MSRSIAKKDWEELGCLLSDAADHITRREIGLARLALNHLHTMASMMNIGELAGAAKKIEEHLLDASTPRWDEETIAVLSFTIEDLVKKMKSQECGPEFFTTLDQSLSSLEFFTNRPAIATPAGHDSVPSGTSPSSFEEKADPRKEGITVEGIISASGSLEQPVRTADAVSGGEAQSAGEVSDPPGWIQPSDPLRYAAPETFGHPADRTIWYSELLKHDPASRVFVLLAEEYCRNGDWENTVQTCRGGLVFHPHDLRGRVLLGWALWQQGSTSEAKALLNEASEELEKNVILYRALAEIAHAEGDADQCRRFEAIYAAFHSSGQDRAVEEERALNEPPLDVRAENPSPVNLLSRMLECLEHPREPSFTAHNLLSDETRRDLRVFLQSRIS